MPTLHRASPHNAVRVKGDVPKGYKSRPCRGRKGDAAYFSPLNVTAFSLATVAGAQNTAPFPFRFQSPPIESCATDLIGRVRLQERVQQLNHMNNGIPTSTSVPSRDVQLALKYNFRLRKETQ
jgi:hypothetical protein